MDAATLEDRPENGTVVVKGKEYMTDAKGSLVPVELIKPADKLEDEVVRKVIAFAEDISAQ